MIKADFPILAESNIVYLDNAATTQKPQCVLDKIYDVYTSSNANVHRSPHKWGREMTTRFENAREKIGCFFGIDQSYHVIFTEGVTDGINLVAYSFLGTFAKEDSEVVIMLSEHHSNFVPWQQLCKKRGIRLRVVPLQEDGTPQIEEYRKMLSSNTCLVAAAHVTNTFGIENPIREMIEIAHQRKIPVLLDGAQAAAHKEVNIADIDCDFYCISSHKIYGPTGIGVLIAKNKWLEQMKPYRYGGEMIEQVSIQDTVFQKIPYRFEAGTPNFVGAVGFAEALKYLEQQGGMKVVEKQENELMMYLWEKLHSIDGIEFPINSYPKSGILSFVQHNFHPYDTAVLLDQLGIAVRSGMHCAQPLLNVMGLKNGTVRASLGIYNTKQDVDCLCEGLKKISRGC